MSSRLQAGQTVERDGGTWVIEAVEPAPDLDEEGDDCSWVDLRRRKDGVHYKTAYWKVARDVERGGR